MSAPFVLSYVLLWVVVILQSLLLLGTVRAIHSLRQVDHGHDHDPLAAAELETPDAERLVGQEIPSFTAVDISGGRFAAEQLLGRSTVVLFVSPNCSSCMLTLEELAAVGKKTNGNVLVVCGEREENCRHLAQDYQLTVPVIVDEDDSIRQLFDVSGAPTAVLLNPNNRVVSYGHPVRGGELQQLMNGDSAATTRS